MSDTSEKMGVAFESDGLKDIAGDLKTVGREVQATGRAFEKAIDRVAKARGKLGLLNAPAILQAANVSVRPPDVGTVTTTTAGNRLSIVVTIKGATSRASSIAQAATEAAARPGARSRYLPGTFRPASGPRQRRDVLMAALQSGQLAGSGLQDTMDAIQRLNNQIAGPQPKRRAYPTGPRQQMGTLHDQMARAISEGNFPAFDDMQERYERLRKRLQPVQPGQRLANALYSSRFGIGKAMPLAGRVADIFGLGGTKGLMEKFGPELAAAETTLAKLGPYGIVIAALTEGTVKAAQAIYELAKNAADTANTFARFSFATGSGAATNSRLLGIGSSIGLNSADMASITQQIQQSITSDPIAMAAGLRLGIFNMRQPFGNLDIGSQTLQAATALRNIKDPDERLRTARSIPGLEALLPLTNLSDKQFSYIGKDAAVRAQIMSPDMIQKSADFQAALGRFTDSIQNLLTAIGSNGLDVATRGLNLLADGINGLANSGRALGDLATLLGEFATGNFGGAGYSLNQLRADAQSGLAKAISENTDATRSNTAAMGQPGSYGHINRQGVGADRLSGFEIRRALDAGGYAMSSF